MDIADIRARKQAPIEEVPVVLDARARRRLEQADAAVDAARTDAELVEAVTERRAARAAAKPHTVVFTFAGATRADFEALRLAHAPTPDQDAEFRAAQLAEGVRPRDVVRLAHNPDTFPPALISLCATDPVISPDDATAMWDGTGPDRWTQAELAEMFTAALRCNQVNRRVDLGED